MVLNLTDSVSETRHPDAGEKVSLTQLAASGIPIAWYEALAIVQQLCSALASQPSHPVVDPSGVFVQPSGDVTVQSSGGDDADVSVGSVGELLRSWLSDTLCPVPIRMVVAQATSAPPFYRSIAELSEALSHYERANRQELVRHVYEHWQGVTADSRDSRDSVQGLGASLRLKLQTLYQFAAGWARAGWKFVRAKSDVLLRALRERWRNRRQRRMLETPAVTLLPQSGIPRWNARVILLTAIPLFAIAGWLVVSQFGLFARTSSTSLMTSITHAEDRVADAIAPALARVLNWLAAFSPKPTDPPPADVHEAPRSTPAKVRPRPTARTPKDRSETAPAAARTDRR